MRFWKRFDIFSQQFYFNIEDQNAQKKSTLLGFCLSVFVFMMTLGYFSYLLVQLQNNQIQPFFRQQSFIYNGLIQTQLNNELIAFKLDSGDIVLSPNKTYLVVMAYFFQQSSNRTFIPLNVIDCTSQELTGYKCLDFSQVSNYSFALDTKKNLFSQIQIFTYGCLDIDKVKTTIPDNCASQEEIDAIINGVNVGLRYKLYSAQFNTTSSQMQSDYRNILVYTFSSQAIVTFLNMQTQTTNVKKGLILQQNSFYQSPFQYSQINQSMDRKSSLIDGQGPFNSFMLQMDEIVYQIQIQYTTLPQILALVNGIFSLLMIVGYIGRKYSQRQINNDFVNLFLKNILPGQYYSKIKSKEEIQHNQKDNQVKLILENRKKKFNGKQNHKKMKDYIIQEQKEVKDPNKIDKVEKDAEQVHTNCMYSIQNEQNDQANYLPNFEVKLKGSLNYSQSNQNVLANLNLKDRKDSFDCKIKKQNSENIDKQLDETKLQDEQLTIFYQESNNQSQNTSFIQYQQYQKTLPENAILETENKNQSCLYSNKLIAFPLLKTISQKKQLISQLFADEPELKSKLENQSIDSKGQIDKISELKIENVKKVRQKKIKKLGQDQYSKQNKENIEMFRKSVSLFHKKLETEQQKPIISQKNIILEQISKDLNIFSLYKDIIFLKKAVMVLFSQEQLAAIKFLGCSPSFLDLRREKLDIDLEKIEQLRKESKINFLDEQFMLYYSEKLQQQQLEQFLSRVQGQENLNEIDERLIASLP